MYNNVVVFHRAERVWNSETFDVTTNIFKQRNLGPIKDSTIITFDRETGNVLNEWGSNLFYMPHGKLLCKRSCFVSSTISFVRRYVGLHINGNYYYVTDVGLHQVFRFNIKNSTTKPELTLGEAFKPGRSSKLFCKPTSVATLDNGDFFVADGYCNSRIVKFNFAGDKILEVRTSIKCYHYNNLLTSSRYQWGKTTFSGFNKQAVEPPNAFAVPHALTLVPDKQLLCVADRENGRIQW